MRTRDLAWIAGLLEGEGCFYLTIRKNKDGSPRPLVAVICSMTDEDVVRRLYSLVKTGGITTRDRKPYKQSWTWNDSKVETVSALIKKLRPWMGKRRQAKIDQMLEAIAGWKRRPVRTHGQRRMYNAGCRCCMCKAANSKVCRLSRNRRLVYPLFTELA